MKRKKFKKVAFVTRANLE
jgi:hypothetical protein